MVKIGNVTLDGLLGLAPMAGVADAALRTVCRAEGAAYSVSEMISAKALLYQDAKTRILLRRAENEYPYAVQLFGSEPETMAEAAKKVRELCGCEIIDLNMGCPVGKVVRNGEGSALMRDLPLAGRIIEAVANAVDVPVTVKFRKGWDKGSVNAVEFARMAESAGAQALCVHGRTRAQLYAGRADWDIIREVKQAVSIPVMANGDVLEPEDAPHILSVTGADFVMIGRGAMGNPWLFSRANAALAGRDIPPMPGVKARADMAEKQFRIALEDKGEKIACLEARKHFCWYLRGIPFAGYAKEKIAAVATEKDVERVLYLIRTEL